ncbi:zinc ribbon domain-containing protein [Candidatus Bathyarchaeota archaeon]|nr:zinc ribbon domain-containing protein [Candidatus Bathyarchaeota archaeon]
MSYCNRCGFPLPEDAEYCPNCGARIMRRQAQKKNSSSPHREDHSGRRIRCFFISHDLLSHTTWNPALLYSILHILCACNIPV